MIIYQVGDIFKLVLVNFVLGVKYREKLQWIRGRLYTIARSLEEIQAGHCARYIHSAAECEQVGGVAVAVPNKFVKYYYVESGRVRMDRRYALHKRVEPKEQT